MLLLSGEMTTFTALAVVATLLVICLYVMLRKV